jgi:hypothetical protein
MSAENTFAREVSKYNSRNVYGIIRNLSDQDELLKLLNKQLILQCLGDSSCLEEFTTEEVSILTGRLALKSEFYG